MRPRLSPWSREDDSNETLADCLGGMHSFRWLCLATLGFSPDFEGIAHPALELRNILHHVLRNLVVSHRAVFAEWPKRLHSPPLEAGSRDVIHLEVQPVLRDEGEENSQGIDSH